MSRTSINRVAGRLVLASVVIFGAVAQAAPYPDMPQFAPIGQRIGQYLPLPGAGQRARH